MSDVEVKRKQKFTGKVVKLSLAGAVVDIETDKPAVLHISQVPQDLKNKSTRRMDEALDLGQEIDVWVRRVKDDHIELTMVKPLDLEWRDVKKGKTVKGTIVRLEKFGAFVEIGAERPGLVHISEMAHGYVREPSELVKEGEEIEAEIIDVHRRKKQIKLSMKALQPEPVVEEKPKPTFKTADPKPSKPKKARKNRSRGAVSGDFLTFLEKSTEDEGEAEPTAMEMALREAMNKAKDRKKEDTDDESARKAAEEQNDIIARTLEHKVKS